MSTGKPIITVVGAGRMGNSIAQVFAYVSHEVHLLDMKEREPEETAVVKAEAYRQIRKNLSLLADCGLFDQAETEGIVSRVAFYDRAQLGTALASADVVFEAVPEVLSLKEAIYEQMNQVIQPETMVASTTSSIVSEQLASFLRWPEHFMNTHWLNPAYVIPLVEVSPAQQTKPEYVQAMKELLTAAGKTAVTVSASPGFIVPRIQAIAMNEAARLVEEGVADVEDIDKATRLGFGLRFAVMGLIEFIDWGGGDTLYYASQYMKDALGAERYTPAEVISRNMQQGRIGMKSGRGFYDFSHMDVSEYERETIRKFVDLFRHLGLLAPPDETVGK